MTDQFNPDLWLTSLFDSLTDYVTAEINAAVGGNGADVYDVVMSYPDSDFLPSDAEFKKTLIHLEIDDIDNRILGYGDNVVDNVIVEPTPTVAGTVTPLEATLHMVNFDVGVWATDASGGVTSRLRIYEILNRAFSTDAARKRCRAVTGGVEIRHFTGGRFVTESINDIRVFRVVGAELETRVYSRTEGVTEILIDREPTQQPDLEISDDSGSLVPLTDEE